MEKFNRFGKLQNVYRIWMLVLGVIFVVIGILGVVLPVMPGTIFLILAAGCFARSSPRLENWLLQHPRFGTTIAAWRTTGAISPKVKAIAITGIAGGYVGFYLGARPDMVSAVLVLIFFTVCALYILTRPNG